MQRRKEVILYLKLYRYKKRHWAYSYSCLPPPGNPDLGQGPHPQSQATGQEGPQPGRAAGEWGEMREARRTGSLRLEMWRKGSE